ncbi:MAG: cellulase family glycosylhydrolase [Chitinispirillia bacterium]|jgi:aryl-phospho-beta-D-glucosidase BglC (GH1 family)
MRLVKESVINTVIIFVFFTAVLAFSQNLPTAGSIAKEMGVAWNIGNTMEVPNNPTAWGNPIPTTKLIDAVKTGGFKTVRIPCAWDSHADQSTLTIDSKWLEQVKKVVDYCIKNGLYVIINSHWDGGWLEHNVKPEKSAEVNKKQGAYWKQIATFFRDYDHHLLFAGANEPAVQDPYGTPFDADRMVVLNSYHQAFIDAVRTTGGNNASRTLIIQGPRTDIELTNKVMTKLPTDKITDRLMAEVHFYPYQFALMENDADWGKVFYYWGKENHSTTDTERNPTWGEESYVDSLFGLMKKQFVDKGIPVVLGEFGAIKRNNLAGESLERHLKSRCFYYEYVVSSAKSRGLIPVTWDAGMGDTKFTIFDRNSGAVYDKDLLEAIRRGDNKETAADNTIEIDYSAKDVFHVVPANGKIMVAFTASKQGLTKITLKNLLGKTIISHTFYLNSGSNKIMFPSNYNGIMILQIKQNGRVYTGKAFRF